MAPRALRAVARFASTLLLALAVTTPVLAHPSPHATATDGVGVDPAGNPFYATFSLCAVDLETGETGVAVTTRVPFVGRAVPWVRAGVGAVATQAWTVVEYGEQGLDLLAEGLEPAAALERLLADDAGREIRQLGIVDATGRAAAHSGSENGAWAGSRQGDGYTVQGNVLVGPEVVEAVARHFESTAGTDMPLAERMILALEAGQDEGGDKRWGYFQSAAIRIADPDDPGRGGDHISLAIDVGEHEQPVREMKRIYYRTARRLGYRDFAETEGPDVVELKRLLHSLGYYRRDLEQFPEPPDFEIDRALSRSDPQAFQDALADYRKLARKYNDAWALYDDEAMAAVDAFREENDLDYVGNPHGLVDPRLVAALRHAANTPPATDSDAQGEDEAPRFRMESLAEGVYSFYPTDEAFATWRAASNSGAIVLDDGVLLYDSHWTPAHLADARRMLRAHTDKPIRYVVSSHFHGDHTGGLWGYPRDVEVITHHATRDRLLQEGEELPEELPQTIERLEGQLEAATDPSLRGRLENVLLNSRDLLARVERQEQPPSPTLTFDHKVVLHRGRTVEVHFLGRGHTDGDAVVLLPEEKIAFVGDLLFRRMLPNLNDGYSREWVETLEKVLNLGATRFVPGHGTISDADDVRTQIAYLRWLRETVEPFLSRGESLEAVQEAVTLPAEYADYELLMFLPGNLAKVYGELQSER